jgi:chromosomal replication initiator protein
MQQVSHESTDSHRNVHTTDNQCTTSIVQQITHQLASRIGSHRFDMWFCDTRFRVDQHRVEVAVANPFIARWIESNFTNDIRSACCVALGREAEVNVEVTHVDPPDAPNGNHRPGADASAATSRHNGIEPRTDLTPRRPDRDAPRGRRNHSPRMRQLDDFVVSETNRVAYGAARQIAEAKNGSHHSPLFIHGPCGVGKTHLLQGACRHYARAWGASSNSVRYVTAEQFTNEYITAVRNGRIDEFRRRMRRLELLAIDDVHFLSNKERTQVEFLHTFDEIIMSGARVVIASDSHPRQLRRINKALVNRMLSGMIVQIELPDLDLRRRLAQKLARDRGLTISDQAIDVIARECTGSIRELEGAINKLLALRASLNQHHGTNGTANSNGSATASNDQIGLVMVQQLFQSQAFNTNTPVRISTIIEVICERLGVIRSELMASGRHKRVVLARSLITYLAKKMTTHSFPEIAAAIGRRNHSTVHNANRRMCEQLEANVHVDLDGRDGSILLAELVNQLKQQIIRRQRD